MVAMKPSLLFVLIAMLHVNAPAHAYATDANADRVRALETQIQSLQQQLKLSQARVQELEGTTQPIAQPNTPATTNDPGTDPWGNPSAAMRTLGNKCREDLLAKGQAIPDANADAKIWRSYRLKATKWVETMAKLKQQVEWKISVSEASLVNSSPREFEFNAHVLNADGARVGNSFVLRCPATAATDLTAANAPGIWILKGELIPNIRMEAEKTDIRQANPFGLTPTIAPQVECKLNYAVQSLTRFVAPTATTPAIVK